METFLSCYFARAAAVSGRPRCARYGLGRRSLSGGSHPRPSLAVAWAVFCGERESGGGCCERCERPKDARNAAWGRRRWFLPMGCVVYPRIYAARCDAVWRGVFGTVYRGIGPSWVRGCHGPAACARFRRGRRVPAPAARAMGAGVPRTVARERCECPEDARNAACRIRRRFLPMGCVVYPRIYAARCDAVWRGVACLGRYIVG